MENETQEITTNNETSLVSAKSILQARQLSGESNNVSIPFIPILKIANNKTKKKVIIDGVEQEIKILCDKGFKITEKTAKNEYTVELFAPTLTAVILKERYEIKSKWKVEPPYFSREFDNWNEKITAINMNNKEVIASGNYTQLKEIFKTSELDSLGNPKKTFDLFLVLYIHILDNDKIYRLKTKMTGTNGWFNYKKSFGNNDTFVAYETVFNLHKEKAGDIDFWQIDYEMGNSIDLENELKLQKEISKYFSVVKDVVNDDEVIELDTTDIDNAIEQQPAQLKEEEEEDIKLEQIPF